MLIMLFLVLTISFNIYLYIFLKKINKEIGNILQEHISVMISVPESMAEQLKITDAHILQLINKLKVKEKKIEKKKSEERGSVIGLI